MALAARATDVVPFVNFVTEPPFFGTLRTPALVLPKPPPVSVKYTFVSSRANPIGSDRPLASVVRVAPAFEAFSILASARKTVKSILGVPKEIQ